MFNWGTFHNRVWGLDLQGDNALLTGDIGSGKSTLVDAVTTLLVPAQKITYNKAAGAEARERTLRSYVLGHFRTERGGSGLSARPVALRDANTYCVILARFVNEALRQTVTLAQVFWLKDVQGQPARLYVVADAALSIAEHFSGFGTEIGQLRKRLRGLAAVETHDAFPAYGAAWRRRFGIENEQALELFHQTVSMKSVGNLTEFVREHMLEGFPVEPRIAALIGHFDDLNRAHEAVLKAKAQIARLAPLVADGDAHAALSSGRQELLACREVLHPWFAGQKLDLLVKRLAGLDSDLARAAARIAKDVEQQSRQRAERDDLKRAIADNGGDRIERIKKEIAAQQREKDERLRRSRQYDDLAAAIDMPGASDIDGFLANQSAFAQARKTAEEDGRADSQNALTETSVEFRDLKTQHEELASELASLRKRRSNIPRRMLDLRAELCRASGLAEEALPFIGELIQVRPGDGDWEGAIERLLHNFGLSVLVADSHYAKVSEWVNRTHLGERLVYFRVRAQGGSAGADHGSLHSASLVRKVAVKPDNGFYGWLEGELAKQFDYACCENLDDFRRERRGDHPDRADQGRRRPAREGRHPPHRRSVALCARLFQRRQDRRVGSDLAWRRGANGRHGGAHRRTPEKPEGAAVAPGCAAKAGRIRQFPRSRLASGGQRDRAAGARKARTGGGGRRPTRLAGSARGPGRGDGPDRGRSARHRGRSGPRARTSKLGPKPGFRMRERAGERVDPEQTSTLFPRLEAMREDVPGPKSLTVESCDNRERDMRDWLQARIDAEDKKISRLAEKIVRAMEDYRNAYPLDAQEADASVAAVSEYRAMLDRLAADDLPRFESRFKTLLNENTIREVANFQSQLNRERQTVRERINAINGSLRTIDYNPGRFIVLEDDHAGDPEIRDFQQDLRACTEGSLTGSEEETYSEAKFLQVRRIIERFRGREGTAELDRRWTAKVTDMRGWFTFSASERWREDDREHEHYSDSGGKSGGQKEKLAYTVLAASLAYQFGLEAGAASARSFRFVVIDEAFGRGSDESARYGLELFQRLRLQLLRGHAAAEDPHHRTIRLQRRLRAQRGWPSFHAAQSFDRRIPRRAGGSAGAAPEA